MTHTDNIVAFLGLAILIPAFLYAIKLVADSSNDQARDLLTGRFTSDKKDKPIKFIGWQLKEAQ